MGELLVWLKETQTWTAADRVRLVDEWNNLRGTTPTGRINLQAVRTPCRLKQIRDSLILFVEKNQNS